MIRQLQKTYRCRYGAPLLSSVDTSIFQIRYFTHCSKCNFCNDWCCQFGVDVSLDNLERIEQHADALEAIVGVGREEWFEPEVYYDEDYPGGGVVCTRVHNGACVFLNRTNRGCMLQTYAIQKGMDYHDLKPMISVIFPLSYGEGLLSPALEIEDKSLVCVGSGLTLYRALREELEYYFGTDFVGELDEIEKSCESVHTQ